MLACDATTLERMIRPCSMTAAPVSSQELSIARMRIEATFHCRWSERSRLGQLRSTTGRVGTLVLLLGGQPRRQRLRQMEVALAIVVRHDIFGPHDKRV